MSSILCQICLGDLFALDVSALGCGHVFHRDCVSKWTALKSSCPNCKQSPRFVVTSLYFNAGDGDDVEKDFKNGVSPFRLEKEKNLSVAADVAVFVIVVVFVVLYSWELL